VSATLPANRTPIAITAKQLLVPGPYATPYLRHSIGHCVCAHSDWWTPLHTRSCLHHTSPTSDSSRRRVVAGLTGTLGGVVIEIVRWEANRQTPLCSATGPFLWSSTRLCRSVVIASGSALLANRRTFRAHIIRLCGLITASVGCPRPAVAKCGSQGRASWPGSRRTKAWPQYQTTPPVSSIRDRERSMKGCRRLQVPHWFNRPIRDRR
jgi:hypothetical protein